MVGAVVRDHQLTDSLFQMTRATTPLPDSSANTLVGLWVRILRPFGR